MTNTHSATLSELEAYVDDLETRLTSARAGYLANLDNANLKTISDISSLTATEIAYLDAKISEVVKQVALTGHPSDSIGKILFELDNNRLTSARAGYLANINNANLATIADISSLTATEVAHLDADISSITPLTAGQTLSAITDDDTKLDGSYLNALTAGLNYPVFNWSVVNLDWFQVVVGTWPRTLGADRWSGAYLTTTATAAANDEIALGCLFIPVTGNYTVYCIYTSNGAHGIAHFMLNGVDKGSIDMYGATVLNVVSDTSLGSLTKGAYVITLKMIDKNASSTDFAIHLQSVIIAKT